ncbi:glutathione S-transferase family protein [Neorhizobium sp. NPDC001467]|uniref:glutathione S-transferase family protein n=1 Tax=Neorhizobium sp. NPDC001467 TaxID=3390595 RepID=UPI003D00DA65
MAEDLLLYTHPMSRGRIARWMLEETGLPYRAETLPFGASMKHAEYRLLNPMGKVPTLVHGQTVVTECAAICAYLADAFPEANLAPPVKERGDYYRWLFYAAGPLEAATTNRTLGVEVSPERERMVGYGTYADVMETLERAVASHTYIGGHRFSAADVYVGSQIGWGMQFGSIEKRPAFVDYFARLSERPAYKRASEIDNALAGEMQAAS